MESLLFKYQNFFEIFEEACRSITTQYSDFRFLVSGEIKGGLPYIFKYKSILNIRRGRMLLKTQELSMTRI